MLSLKGAALEAKASGSHGALGDEQPVVGKEHHKKADVVSNMNTRCSKKKYVVYSIPYTLLYNMYQLKQLCREHDRFVTRQFHSIHPDQGLKAPAVEVQLDSGFGGSGPSGKGG